MSEYLLLLTIYNNINFKNKIIWTIKHLLALIIWLEKIHHKYFYHTMHVVVFHNFFIWFECMYLKCLYARACERASAFTRACVRSCVQFVSMCTSLIATALTSDDLLEVRLGGTGQERAEFQSALLPSSSWGAASLVSYCNNILIMILTPSFYIQVCNKPFAILSSSVDDKWAVLILLQENSEV